MSKTATKTNDDMTLEAAMKRLSEIVSALENSNADLDASLKLYEEGVGLVRLCGEKLDAAEERVKVLRLSADGEGEAVPFTEGNNA